MLPQPLRYPDLTFSKLVICRNHSGLQSNKRSPYLYFRVYRRRSFFIYFSIVVRAKSAGTAIATTSITSSTPTDPNSSNNSDSVSVPVTLPIADLALSMSAPTTSVPVGSSFSYTLVVTNHGPDASGIGNVLQTLPANVIFQSSDDCVNITDSQFVSCGIDIASGASVSMVVNVLAITTGSNISSSADVGSLMSSDPISGNNISSATVTIIPSADIQAVIALPAQNSVHLPDSDVTYTVRARNTIGPSNAENVVLTVTFPSSFTNIRPPTGCTLSGRVVTCNFSSVAFGATVTKLITIHTPMVATTNLRTLAQVSLSTFDPNTTNNRMVRIISVQ